MSAPKTKICRGRCKQEKPLHEFSKDKSVSDGHKARCKACDAQAHRRLKEQEPEQLVRYQNAATEKKRERYRCDAEFRALCQERTRRSWAKRPPAAQSPARFKSMLKTKYGISLEEYDQLYDSVSGRCEICKRELRPLHRKDAPQVGLKPNVDYDHKTERIRGLLCHECNPGIGQFQHDTRLLLQAIRYLERHGQVCKQKSNC